jgi:DHA2 family multidrug resistance protein-like MFS transporter
VVAAFAGGGPFVSGHRRQRHHGVNSALLRAIYPAKLLGRGFGTNSLVVAVAFAVGPTVASMILSVLSWPWLFAINVPLGIIAFFLARKALPITPRAAHKVDGLTAVYNVAAFGLLILALGDAAHLSNAKTLLPEIGMALIHNHSGRRCAKIENPCVGGSIPPRATKKSG